MTITFSWNWKAFGFAVGADWSGSYQPYFTIVIGFLAIEFERK